MDVQSPELPGRLSLRLDVYSPPQVLQINGRLCHLVLAFPYVGDIANGTEIGNLPELHRHGRSPAQEFVSSQTRGASYDCAQQSEVRRNIFGRRPPGRRASHTAVLRRALRAIHLEASVTG